MTKEQLDKFVAFRKKFSSRLFSLMYDAKYTVENMSEMTNISEDVIRDFLYDGGWPWPNLKDIYILAEVLEVEPYELLKFEE